MKKPYVYNYHALDYDEIPRVLVKANGARRWTSEEDEKMLKYLLDHSQSECDRYMKRHAGSTRMRLKTLNEYGNKRIGCNVLPPNIKQMLKEVNSVLKTRPWNNWTKNELDFIKANIKKSRDDLYVEFRNAGFRPVSFWSFYQCYRDLSHGNSEKIRYKRWTMQDDVKLMKAYLSGKSQADIGADFSVSGHVIQQRIYCIRKQKNLGYDKVTLEYKKLQKRLVSNLQHTRWSKAEHDFVMKNKTMKLFELTKAYNKQPGFHKRTDKQINAHRWWYKKAK